LERQAADGTTRLGSALLVAAGLAGLVIGAQLMVYAAVEMARALGVSELVIGLTIVAVGTSLPELATSVVGAYRRQADIVVGNVLGSNLVNVLCIMGLVSQVQPLAVHDRSLSFDLPVMTAFALALLPIMRSGLKISRVEGALLLAAYAAFLASHLF
jgi:cation:H+ antiporter